MAESCATSSTSTVASAVRAAAIAQLCNTTVAHGVRWRALADPLQCWLGCFALRWWWVRYALRRANRSLTRAMCLDRRKETSLVSHTHAARVHTRPAAGSAEMGGVELSAYSVLCCCVAGVTRDGGGQGTGGLDPVTYAADISMAGWTPSNDGFTAGGAGVTMVYDLSTTMFPESIRSQGMCDSCWALTGQRTQMHSAAQHGNGNQGQEKSKSSDRTTAWTDRAVASTERCSLSAPVCPLCIR